MTVLWSRAMFHSRKSGFARHNRLLPHIRFACIARRHLVDSKLTLTRTFLYVAIVLMMPAIFTGSLLAQQQLGATEEATQQTPRARREAVVPMVTGTNGTQTGTAAFFRSEEH